jgi:hypothetical protein
MEHGVRASWAVTVIGTLKALLEREAGRCELGFCVQYGQSTLCWSRRRGQLAPSCHCITIVSEFDLMNVLDAMEIITACPSLLLRNHDLVGWFAVHVDTTLSGVIYAALALFAPYAVSFAR